MELNQSSVPASVWWNSQSSVTSWWVRLWSTWALPRVLLCLIFSFVSGVTEVKIWCYFFKFFICFFFLFWLCWVLVAVQAFLWLWRAGATTRRGAWASHCGGLPREAWALGWEGFSSCSSWALENRLSTCGTRALMFFDMWDLPRLGIKPAPPALAGGFFTTEPLWKSLMLFLDWYILWCATLWICPHP